MNRCATGATSDVKDGAAASAAYGRYVWTGLCSELTGSE